MGAWFWLWFHYALVIGLPLTGILFFAYLAASKNHLLPQPFGEPVIWIRFVDRDNNFTDAVPAVETWDAHPGFIAFALPTNFWNVRLSNATGEARTVDRGIVSILVKGKELERHEWHPGIRVDGHDTSERVNLGREMYFSLIEKAKFEDVAGPEFWKKTRFRITLGAGSKESRLILKVVRVRRNVDEG